MEETNNGDKIMLKRVVFYRDGFEVDYLWILLDGKIHTQERNDMVHAEVWGDMAWDIPYRGYYCVTCGQVTCHAYGGVPGWLEKMLAKTFPEAMYLQDSSAQFAEVS